MSLSLSRRGHIEIAVDRLQRHVLYILNRHIAVVQLQRGLRRWLWSWRRRKVGRRSPILRNRAPVCNRSTGICNRIGCQSDVGKGGWWRGHIVDRVHRVQTEVGGVHHVEVPQIGQLVHCKLLHRKRGRKGTNHLRLGTVLLLQRVQLMQLVDLKGNSARGYVLGKLLNVLLRIHQVQPELLLVVGQQHLNRGRIHRHCLRLLVRRWWMRMVLGLMVLLMMRMRLLRSLWSLWRLRSTRIE
jgi:hypothetical protein